MEDNYPIQYNVRFSVIDVLLIEVNGRNNITTKEQGTAKTYASFRKSAV